MIAGLSLADLPARTLVRASGWLCGRLVCFCSLSGYTQLKIYKGMPSTSYVTRADCVDIFRTFVLTFFVRAGLYLETKEIFTR
jgi:hypothetical protein